MSIGAQIIRLWGPLYVVGPRVRGGRPHIVVRWDHAVIISTVYTGILIQILIQIGCAYIYTEANWIQIQTQTTSPMWIVIQISIRIRDLILVNRPN